MIYLEVCRSPPGSIPTLRLVPSNAEPELLCHRLFKWPLQGQVDERTFASPLEAMLAALAAGYQGDPLQLLDLIEQSYLT